MSRQARLLPEVLQEEMEEAETVGSELWLPIKLNKSLHIPGTAEERARVPTLPETKCSGVILLFSVLTCM